MSNVNYIGMLPPKVFPLFNGSAELLLRKALGHGAGEYALADVLDELEDLRMLAFGEVVQGALTSLLVVKLIEYPRMRVLHLAYGAGRNLGRMEPYLREFCREQNVSRVDVWSRGAVARLLRRYGFATQYHVSCMELAS